MKKRVSLLLIGLSILLFSCSENNKTKGLGVMRVTKVTATDGKLCKFKIESDDILGEDGFFTITCPCEKFKGNDRVELVVIYNKHVETPLKDTTNIESIDSLKFNFDKLLIENEDFKSVIETKDSLINHYRHIIEVR